jgi:hypothetical protein
MNKEQKSVVVEYVSALSEEALKFHTLRLSEKISGDLGESLDELSKDLKVDEVLRSAESAEAFFTLIDNFRDVFLKECKKRGIHLKMSYTAA